MLVTVHDLKKALEDFPEDRLVYIVYKDGLTQPKLVDAFMDPEVEKELPKEDRLGKFVLIAAED